VTRSSSPEKIKVASSGATIEDAEWVVDEADVG
jgi:hypothetical protein